MSKIAAEIFLVVGVVVGALLVWQLIKGMRSKNWPTAPGSVIDAQITMHYDDDGDRMYGASIHYRYTVDGLEYSGDKRTFGDFSSNNRRRAENIVGQYPSGSAVQVYHHPDDPEDSVLEPGTKGQSFLFLLLPLIFIGLGVAGFLGLL